MEHAKQIILVVDDEPGWRNLLVEQLGSFGYLAVAVESAPRALSYVAQRNLQYGEPGILGIITDLTMPGIDGLELTDQIRADKLSSGIPIILASNGVNDVRRAEFKAHGVDAVIPKPFALVSLLYAIIEAQDQRAAA